jgi:hypothetical protein
MSSGRLSLPLAAAAGAVSVAVDSLAAALLAASGVGTACDLLRSVLALATGAIAENAAPHHTPTNVGQACKPRF